jgi:hypothetical protein
MKPQIEYMSTFNGCIAPRLYLGKFDEPRHLTKRKGKPLNQIALIPSIATLEEFGPNVSKLPANQGFAIWQRDKWRYFSTTNRRPKAFQR